MAAASRPAIGNDVVDLTRAEARGKARDERFVRRVFTAAEAAFIRRAAAPDRMLWMLWAAKEAAFKVVSKQERGALFAHRWYEVQKPSPAALDAPAGRTCGVVSIPAGRAFEVSAVGVPAPATRDVDPGAPIAEVCEVAGSVPADGGGQTTTSDTHAEGTRVVAVEWEWSELRVHCLAASDPCSFRSIRSAVGFVDVAAPQTAVWTRREMSSARTPESREARLLAKRLAFEAGLGDVEVVRNPGVRRLGPPLLYALDATTPLAEWDLTLSHDGGFAAAALCAV